LPSAAFEQHPPPNLLGNARAYGALAALVNHRRRNPHIAHEDGRRAQLLPFVHLAAKEGILYFVNEAAVAIEQPCTVENAYEFAVIVPHGRGCLEQHTGTLFLPFIATGEAGRNYFYARPLGEVFPLLQEIIVGHDLGSADQCAVAQHGADNLVVALAVARLFRVARAHDDRSLAVGQRENVEMLARADGLKLALEEARVAALQRVAQEKPHGSESDGASNLTERHAVEFAGGAEVFHHALLSLRDDVLADEMHPHHRRHRARHQQDHEKARYQLCLERDFHRIYLSAASP